MKNLKVADKEELLKVLDKNGNWTNQFEKRTIIHKNGDTKVLVSPFFIFRCFLLF